MVVALTAALAGAVALAAYAGAGVLVLAVGLVQGLVAVSWHRALAVPGAPGGIVLACVAALAADLLLVLRDEPRPLVPVTGVLGLAIVGGLVHQLVRRPDRDRVTSSLAASVTLVVVVVIASLYLPAEQTDGAAALVAVVALAAALGRAFVDIPVPEPAAAALAVAAGGGLGAVLGASTDLGVGPGAQLGATAALVAVVARLFVARTLAPDRLLGAALPVAAAGAVAYVLGRILVG